MEENKQQSSPLRFGIFELDFNSGELRRHGRMIKLQEQPCRVLAMLLEQPGDLVTREALQRRLWPADTFVDFERGLNRAINKLREALKDNAESPSFIETIPRRGYRFIAPVQTAELLEKSGPSVIASTLSKSEPDSLLEAQETTLKTSPSSLRALTWTVVAALAAIALFGAWRFWRAGQVSAERPLLQFDLNVSPDEFSTPAISRDGSRIVFVSQGALVIRRFDQAKNTRLANTEGAYLPFFSPSGEWVAFFARDRLLKIAVDGGAPVDLCYAPNPTGGTWLNEDSIVASLDAFNEGLSRISASGGKQKLLTELKPRALGTLPQMWPQALPGGKSILFDTADGSGHNSLQIMTLADGKVKKLLEGVSNGRCIAAGYLIYVQHGTLFGAPLDLRRLELAGPGVPLVSGVADPGGLGRAEYDVSHTGVLVYKHGASGTNFLASWLYPSGKTEPIVPDPGPFLTPRLSPDGKRFATALVQEGRQKIWVYDLHRRTWTRVTSDVAPELLPTWTPDGEFLAFRSGNGLAWARADGSGNVQHLSGASANAGPWSFSGDGKWLGFWPLEPDSDLWSVPVERKGVSLRLGTPQVLLQQANSSKGAPAISSDNRWLAYSSNESGRFEIYVVPFPVAGRAAGGKWPVSNSGGVGPIWSPNRHELFFQSLDHHVEVVSFSVKEESFVAGQPRAWCQTRLGSTGIFQAFDVAPDGNRLLALIDPEDATAETALHIMLNVSDELRRRAGNPSIASSNVRSW